MVHSQSASIVAIFRSPGHDFKGRFGKGRLRHGVEPMDAVECHAGRGVVGDRYYDYREDYKGQVTLFAMEVADALAAERGWPSLDLSGFRRNVITRGLDLNALVGRTFRLGEVLLEGSERCAPCLWMDEVFGAGTEDWLVGRGGLRCRIAESGTLRVGEVTMELPRPV